MKVRASFIVLLVCMKKVSSALSVHRRSKVTMIKSTATTNNLEVLWPPSPDAFAPISVDIMQERLVGAGNRLGLYLSHVTTLGRNKYPGNRHWHLKRMPREPGCLDVTYWPRDGSSHGAFSIMWISMRHREPAWVHEFGPKLKAELENETTGHTIEE